MEELEKQDLHEKFATKAEELKEKYKDVINALSLKYDKDVGVAYDMLRAIAIGNEEYGEGIEFDLEEVKKDFGELNEIGTEIAKAEGWIY